MSSVTVLTPTYNRKELLKNLYKSLSSQENKDFEWLIIDDGSSDGTEELIDTFIHEADFQIEYYRKNNGGKHTALNYGVSKVSAPLVFIVDSDDCLTEDAIGTIVNTYKKYEEEKDLCGFSFLRGKPNGGYLSDSGVPRDGMKETYVDCRVNRNIGGDMAEVWYTKCLKEFPFPEFRGEKFLGEDIVWVRMSEKYKLRFFNKVIYISDYLDDGLTNNRRKHNIASPRGCVERAKTFLDANVGLKVKIKSILQLHIYGWFAGCSHNEVYKRSYAVLYYLSWFPAKILYYKWKKEY